MKLLQDLEKRVRLVTLYGWKQETDVDAWKDRRSLEIQVEQGVQHISHLSYLQSLYDPRDCADAAALASCTEEIDRLRPVVAEAQRLLKEKK